MKNKMQEIKIEKIVLSAGATGEKLDRAVKLLNIISGMKTIKTSSNKRIPGFGIRPGLEIGCKVTLRGKKGVPLLKRLLQGVKNEIKESQIEENHLSFGIEEYIEVPGLEYQRDIGILGFNVTVVFERKGKRVKIKKIKRGKIPPRQNVSKEEIIDFMKIFFELEVKNDSK
ncbi:MAG: 50S ribosomal protein L5 [archaeon]